MVPLHSPSWPLPKGLGVNSSFASPFVSVVSGAYALHAPGLPLKEEPQLKSQIPSQQSEVISMWLVSREQVGRSFALEEDIVIVVEEGKATGETATQVLDAEGGRAWEEELDVILAGYGSGSHGGKGKERHNIHFVVFCVGGDKAR